MNDEELKVYRKEWLAELGIAEEAGQILGDDGFEAALEFVYSYVGDYSHAYAMVSYLMY